MKGLIEAIEREGLKENVPQFNVGDTVKVGYRIIEGGKERIQNFEGVVIAKKHGGIRESSARASRCAVFPSASVWSAASPCTPPRSPMSPSSVRAR